MPDNLIRNELLEAIVEEYPWFPEYPVDCHMSCARWQIADEWGHKVGEAWDRYSTYLLLLGRAHPNMVRYLDEETS
ncbi:hypothetical protein SEA_STLSCUM_71 [Mycobacterium phage STLscum]|nr:hypothetical protein SEA_STLSCUM_71 [Mycobacterium phage STLscum]